MGVIITTMPQITHTTKLVTLLAGVSVMAVVLYNNFASYNPKTLLEVPEVRGSQNIKTDGFVIPYPVKSQKISDNITPYTRQITLRSEQSSEKIQDFYYTILTADNWELDSEREGDVFDTAKYKLADDYIIVTTSQDSDRANSGTTIVSIEVLQNSGD